MAYATAADLNTLVQGDVDSATAQLLIDLAMGAVDGEVGASLEETAYAETFDDDSPERDGDTIWLVPPDWPLEVDSVAEAGTTLTEGDDYTVKGDDRIVRNGGDWDGEVEVTYTTGFTSGDEAFEAARRVTLEVAARAASNPEQLDALTADGVAPSFVVRDNNLALPPLALSTWQKRDLEPWRWRRRFA